MVRKKATGAPSQEADKSGEASNKRPTRSTKAQESEAATPSNGTSELTAGELPQFVHSNDVLCCSTEEKEQAKTGRGLYIGCFPTLY